MYTLYRGIYMYVVSLTLYGTLIAFIIKYLGNKGFR